LLHEPLNEFGKKSFAVFQYPSCPL